jgi:hypothetical protein
VNSDNGGHGHIAPVVSIASDGGARHFGVGGVAPATLGVLLDAVVPITRGCGETSMDELEFDSREEEGDDESC